MAVLGQAEAVNGHGRGQIDVKDLRCDKQINCRHHASHCSNSHLLRRLMLLLLDDLQWPPLQKCKVEKT